MVSRAYTGAYETISTNRVVGIDLVNKGNLARASVSEFNFPMVAERVGIDLDEAQIPLSGYKVINRIYPQASTVSSDPEIYFEFGATNLATEVTNFNPGIVFNMATEYKVDTRMSGRYLSYKVGTATPKDFALSGFDIDLQIVGRR
jgi:hypothetical protein